MAVETSQALQHLHHLLQQLDDAETLLDHGPRRIAAAKKKTAAAEQSVADQKDEIQTLRKAADQKSLNLKSHEADILKLSGRLNEASSNKEYDIIQSQIEAQKSVNEELEDEILTLLTQVDEAEARLADAQAEVSSAATRAGEVETEVQDREPGIRQDIERLTGEIKGAESAIPAGDSRGAYERMKASMKSGALSEVQDSFCLACNTKVIAQDVVRIRVGEVVACRECGRILYSTDEAE